MSSRRAVGLLLLVLALVLTFVAFGSPSFTWGNEGVRVQHPWAQAVAAFGAALALAGAAFGFERPAPRVALGLAAAALVGLSADHLAWRFEAIDAGVNERSLRGAVSLQLERDRVRGAQHRRGDAALAQRQAARDRHEPLRARRARPPRAHDRAASQGSRDQMNRCSSSSVWLRRRCAWGGPGAPRPSWV